MSPFTKTLLLALVMGVLALVLGSTGLDLRRQAEITAAWSSTEGVVRSGKVNSRRVPRATLGGSQRRGNYLYSAQIIYEYTVDGQSYTSDQIGTAKGMLSWSRGTSGAAYEATWLAKYPEGKRVTVYFDPDDPSNAVLERDQGAVAYAMLAAAGLFALLGVGMLRSAIRQRREGGVA